MQFCGTGSVMTLPGLPNNGIVYRVSMSGEKAYRALEVQESIIGRKLPRSLYRSYTDTDLINVRPRSQSDGSCSQMWRVNLGYTIIFVYSVHGLHCIDGLQLSWNLFTSCVA